MNHTKRLHESPGLDTHRLHLGVSQTFCKPSSHEYQSTVRIAVLASNSGELIWLLFASKPFHRILAIDRLDQAAIIAIGLAGFKPNFY
jgi:hypothetical protein